MCSVSTADGTVSPSCELSRDNFTHIGDLVITSMDFFFFLPSWIEW